MKLAVILTHTEAETVFNAFRLCNYSLRQGDTVRVFLMGKAVEIEGIPPTPFDVKTQAKAFLEAGGEILACGTCLKLRGSEGGELCPLSTLKDVYELTRDSDKVLTF